MKSLDTVDHIAIQVNNIEQALKWYQTHFKVKLLYQDDSWALVQFDNIKLALISPKEHPPHFAIEEESPEKFGKTQTHRDKTVSTYIHDLDNNVVELIKITP